MMSSGLSKNFLLMSDEIKDKKIAYRASEEFRRQLQIAAIERGLKVQNLIDEALDAYLAAEEVSDQRGGTAAASGPFQQLTPQEQKFLLEMLEFYRRADDTSVKLVRQHAAAIAELRNQSRSVRKTG